MPAALDRHRLYNDPGCPDPARRVCVTDSGMIKLICVSDHDGRSIHIARDHYTYKITTWNLIDNAWEADATMEELGVLECSLSTQAPSSAPAAASHHELG